MVTSLANVIAGLGLFFAGIWFLSENLKRATSRRFRQGVITWTRTPVMGFGVGAIAGALTQSMSVTVFILVGLLRAGLIEVKSALPVIAGANLGLSALVFAATLETQLVMLFVIGIVGFALNLELSDRFRRLFGALFGLSMLFLGIDLIQSGAVPLLEQDWAEEVLVWARESYLAGFISGAVLTCLSQSSAAISILAITLADAGVFGVEQTIMIIYGTNLGSSAITLALSWNLRGGSLQVALYQVAFNIVGCLILVPLFYLEVYGGIPLVQSLVIMLTNSTDLQMAYVYLLFNMTGALALMIALNPASRLLVRFCPPTPTEDFSRPQFIHDVAFHDPETALDLVLREQRREFGLIMGYLGSLRATAASGARPISDRHAAFETLSAQVVEFIENLGSRDPSSEIYERLAHVLSYQRLLKSTETTLWELATAVRSIEHHSSLQPLRTTVVEALDRVAGAANEAIYKHHDVERWADTAMDSRTSEALQGVRRAFLAHDAELDAKEKRVLFEIANLSERFFWLLSHLPIDELSQIDAPGKRK